jgi:hypothetical protein
MMPNCHPGTDPGSQIDPQSGPNSSLVRPRFRSLIVTGKLPRPNTSGVPNMMPNSQSGTDPHDRPHAIDPRSSENHSPTIVRTPFAHDRPHTIRPRSSARHSPTIVRTPFAHDRPHTIRPRSSARHSPTIVHTPFAHDRPHAIRPRSSARHRRHSIVTTFDINTDSNIVPPTINDADDNRRHSTVTKHPTPTESPTGSPTPSPTPSPTYTVTDATADVFDANASTNINTFTMD